jgi:hypothetical protein
MPLRNMSPTHTQKIHLYSYVFWSYGNTLNNDHQIGYYHFYTRMENTHTSHSCLQSHQNFHTRLSSNKTLLLLVVELLNFQKKVQAWMKHQNGKTPMLIIPNYFYWKKWLFWQLFYKNKWKDHRWLCALNIQHMLQKLHLLFYLKVCEMKSKFFHIWCKLNHVYLWR